MRNTIITAAATFIAASAIATGVAIDSIDSNATASLQAEVLRSQSVAGDYSEDHPLFDCRVDGNDTCGPDALVPVPRSGAIVYVPWTTAPAPIWRMGAD